MNWIKMCWQARSLRLPLAPLDWCLKFLDLSVGIEVTKREPRVLTGDKPSPPTMAIWFSIYRRAKGQSVYRRFR